MLEIAFQAISKPQESVSDETFEVLEKFTVLLYHKGGEDLSLNRVRKLLFISKSCNLQSLSPTRETLRHHCLLSAYQAEQVWGHVCLEKNNVPGPEVCGWTMVAAE